MKNNIEECDFNPTRKDKFHRTARDKERSDDGLLMKLKLVTCKSYRIVV